MITEFVTPSGSREKTIFRLDETKQELVPIRKIDFQEYIQSFSNETNYKRTIEQLGAKEITPEVILEHFPHSKNAFYGDYSKVPIDRLDAISLANDFSEYVEEQEISKKQVKPTKKETEDIENEKI